ncbi:metal-dependent transcriptional regulator [Salinigranum halophilum]|jgi:Mn-dependent DtxR family transcriptional regulator|uniref:metal-dependent transcriptional regulator n=1 Tax=Salinigranum halophilum TaxID=2565931 RepID=UPI0010A858CE|nr:metal-dependent transcriptional regulator [Salinigranum halophilum]
MSGAPQYLLVLYLVEQADSDPVAPGVVADALDRSPAATTEMLQRLAARGLVTHEPYEGATLTPDGREDAEELYETYVTLSRFFDEVLGLDDADEEAMRLAGNVSPVVADRLATSLLEDRDTASEDTVTRPSFLRVNKR